MQKTNKKPTKCEDCKKRKGIIYYSSEPFMTLTHGWGGIYICRQCFIKRIENHLKDCKKQLKEQKALLRKEIWKTKKQKKS